MSEEYKPKKIPKFSPEEDKQLTYLIVECKHTNWVTIASLMPGRNVRQCRERWRHVLCKKASNTTWTPEEDKLLMDKYKEYGRKWNQIQTSLPNHTVVQVKSRIKEILHEDLHPRKTRSRKSQSRPAPFTAIQNVSTIPADVPPQQPVMSPPQVPMSEGNQVIEEPVAEVPVKILEKQILPVESEEITRNNFDAFDSLFNSLNFPFRSRESSLEWFGLSQDNLTNFWN